MSRTDSLPDLSLPLDNIYLRKTIHALNSDTATNTSVQIYHALSEQEKQLDQLAKQMAALKRNTTSLAKDVAETSEKSLKQD